MKIFVLISHTLRELFVKATLIVLASISTIILLAVSFSVSRVETPEGVSLVLFGNSATPALPAEEFDNAVRPMQAGLAGGLIAGIVLFGVFATAAILPETLEKGTIDLYLSKPIARWELIIGRSLGAVAIIFLNIAYFIGGLWLIFGLKLGVWNGGLIWSMFSLTLMFAGLFSIVAFIGVLSRNTAISIIGGFLYLLIIGSALYHRETGLYLLSTQPIYRGVLDGLYYIFPQLSALQDAVGRQITGQSVEWQPFVQTLGSSVLFTAAAAAILRRRDF